MLNKKTLSALFLSLGMSATAHATTYIGVETWQVKSNEIGGFAIETPVYKDYSLYASANSAYAEGTIGNADSKWYGYTTYALGVTKPLAKFGEGLQLSATLGLEMVTGADDLSTKDSTLNRFGQVNLDAPFGFGEEKNLLVRFALGTTGKGMSADKLDTAPDIHHGFMTKFGIYYGF
jgi:hypothetical protein